MPYVILALAILFEVIGTSLLKLSEEFSRPWPTAGLFLCYGVAFFLMTIVMRSLPVGVVYAIWSGCGIVLISIASYFLYTQSLDLAAMIGIALIIAGVVVINVFSKSSAH